MTKILLVLSMMTMGVLMTIFMKLIVIDNNQTVYLSINMSWSESVFLLSLSIITLVMMVFGENYMMSEIVAGGFWITYMAFVMGMGALILFSDMFGLFFGWEMLGISSYMLVSYYHTALSSNGALKTVFTNRVGDVMFVGFIGIVLTQNTTLATFLVVMFCVCKSAQYPFSAWLPAAMAAPTPVSALVHSSTLVTAGLWMLLKLNVMVPFSLIVGLVTMLVGGICAIMEADLKKLVAYSTLSQLGLMMVGTGMNPASSMFVHLITHAFFKSILFVCVGLLILSSLHNQVANKMGQVSPSVMLAATVSMMSMSGISFSAGFYSKHGLSTVLLFSNHSYLVIVLFCTGVCFTSIYSGRLMLYLLKQTQSRTKTSTELLILSFFLIGSVLLGKMFTGDIGFSLFSPVISFLFVVMLMVFFLSYCNQQAINTIFFSIINKKLASISYPMVDSWEKVGLIVTPLAAETLVSKPAVIVFGLMLLVGLL